MSIELRYADSAWREEQRHEAHGRVRIVETQEVWQELSPGEWLCAHLVRVPSLQGKNVAVEEAWLKRELQPNGVWRSGSSMQNAQRIALVPDPAVLNTTPPTPPAKPDTAGARYLASRDYAVPGKDAQDVRS